MKVLFTLMLFMLAATYGFKEVAADVRRLWFSCPRGWAAGGGDGRSCPWYCALPG